jgi:hypothetical protein
MMPLLVAERAQVHQARAVAVVPLTGFTLPDPDPLDRIVPLLLCGLGGGFLFWMVAGVMAAGGAR